ncbi:MAG: 23S rRNA (pseudouridine(1915)-N(3))-methyltransferase RlmH [Clostridia bacterium]|nr:23S rRNA (pseudouridine(1915)-N(3))-methyltransferase RlmH [Clostridia bacterium]
MTSLTIIAVGNIKEAYLRDGIAEYRKRISAYANCEIKELKEEKIANEDDRTAVAAALRAEGERILAAVPRDAFTVALCVEGKSMDSPSLAALLSKGIDRSGKVCLLIGSSHGLSPEVKASADFRLSFSPLTFPHQLMRLVLMESLYRSMTIIAGKKYHK